MPVTALFCYGNFFQNIGNIRIDSLDLCQLQRKQLHGDGQKERGDAVTAASGI